MPCRAGSIPLPSLPALLHVLQQGMGAHLLWLELGVPCVPLVCGGRLGEENFPREQQEAREPDFLLPNLWPHKHISAGAGGCCSGASRLSSSGRPQVTGAFPALLLTSA